MALPHVISDRLDIQRNFDALELRTPMAVVTALPSQPFDGQEIFYLASDSAGVVWHLRYRLASASSYKWEYVGGPPLLGYTSGEYSTGSTSYEYNAPTVTVPLAGDYDFRWQAYAYHATADVALTIGAAPNPGSISANAEAAFGAKQASNVVQTINGGNRFLALAASDAKRMAFKSSVAGGAFGERQIMATPVRVG